MAVFRVERTRDYTVMCNHHLKDSNLSLKAKGLLSMMLSLPDEWNYTTRGLAAICKEGVDAIGKTLKELEQAGYIIRRRLRGKDGRISDTEYTIFEKPRKPKNSAPDTTLPDTENPYMVNPDMEESDAEEPDTDNPAQLNTKKSNTQKTITVFSATYRGWRCVRPSRSPLSRRSICCRRGKPKEGPASTDATDAANGSATSCITPIPGSASAAPRGRNSPSSAPIAKRCRRIPPVFAPDAAGRCTKNSPKCRIKKTPRLKAERRGRIQGRHAKSSLRRIQTPAISASQGRERSNRDVFWYCR